VIRRIRIFGAVVIVLYLALFVQLNLLQVARGEELRTHPLNTRPIVRAFTEERGPIVTADGEIMAETVEVADDLERLRVYPQDDLYAHVTGFLSLNFGATGLERVYNAELAGDTFRQRVTGLGDLLNDEVRVATVHTTIDSTVQAAAREALGERRGSVVAIDLRDGSVLGLFTYPSYDPNELSSHDLTAVTSARQRLLGDADQPLLEKTFRELFSPGSSFKVVTAGAALDSGEATTAEPVFPVTDEYLPPQTSRPIRNFGGSSCGGDLVEIMRVSCNTAFAQLGVDLGAETMVSGAEAAGFNSVPPFDLEGAVASRFPLVEAFDQNIPLLAQASIGQFDVRATPLQMALLAAAVGNEGGVPRPHVVDQVVSSDGTVLEDPDAGLWRRAFSSATAASLKQMMIVTAQSGTAVNMLPEGVTGGGKTGTAQLSQNLEATNAWIIGFAPAEEPRVAIAVILEGIPGDPQQTGGSVAAPVARQVLAAALAATDPAAQEPDVEQPEPSPDESTTTSSP
jgi:penicillin-binding protein A